ncbi:MAG: hypothetical protein R3185_02175, partial [Candidatus Thermoplasmatota archaeon]|nr:hypothetical protein [Candidatus Thermoplasmatota archaeon]
LAVAAGWWVGRLAGLAEDQRRCLVFEVGFQNGTLGIVLAVSQLGSAQAALMPGFYSLVMFVTGGALAWAWSKRAPSKAPPGRPRPGPDGVEFEVVVEPLARTDPATPG